MTSLKEMMANKKKAIQEKSGRRQQTVRPKDGKTRWRLLPSWRGLNDPKFFHDFGQHFIKNEKKELKAVYVCTEKTFERPCPLCEQISEAIFSARSDDQKALFNSMKSSARILMNAIQVDGPTPDQPVILELSPTTFNSIISIVEEYLDSEDELFNIVTDPEKGVDIIIERTGTGLDTSYTVQPALRGSKPVSPKVLEKLHNLDEYVAQEYEQGLLKASTAVKMITGTGGATAASKPAQDEAFDDDVPDYGSKPDDIIEGDYRPVDPDIGDDELNDLLNQLED